MPPLTPKRAAKRAAKSAPKRVRSVPIIFLCGPPRVGKDRLAHATNLFSVSSSETLKIIAADILRKLVPTEDNVNYSDFESYKNPGYVDPLGEVVDLDRRRFLIDLSEKVIKAHLGRDVFGIDLGLRVVETANTVRECPGVVVTGVGFTDELVACLDVIKRDAVVQVRTIGVRLSRLGCTYDYDSRYDLLGLHRAAWEERGMQVIDLDTGMTGDDPTPFQLDKHYKNLASKLLQRVAKLR